MKVKKWVFRTGVIAAVLLLSACFSKVTLDNYNSVNEGMSLSEVVNILGEPNDSSDINLGIASASSNTWKGENGETITIQFFNGKVKLKNFSQ